ncbi:hypothetical protein [Rhodococcus sp. 11-3]|uniref:hypothetical protein n=1 Tax=Rhodococcus sp. 11-3 TaxID=2854796 RepID=UPI00203A9E6B|nr:hypothetical protein [Rhodococcus sp. 11-3]USC17057.1 hypothetical protein KZJ41_09395 [Rhodococcus sp. 11-3]
MKLTTALAVTALSATLVTACAGTAEDKTVFPPPESVAGKGVAEAPLKSVVSEHRITVGQPTTMTTTEGVAVDFTITGMTPMPGSDCPSVVYDGPPDARYLKIDLTVRTRQVVPGDYSSLFDEFLWKVRGDNGEVIEDAGMEWNAFSCLDSEQRGDEMDKLETNSIYHKSIVLPQEGPTGTVILEPGYESDDRFELRY